MQIIADRIKQARLNKGLSQEELSKQCGWLTRARVSNYEKGRRIPAAKDIIAISKVLNVSIDWLYGKNIPPTLTEQLQKFIEHAPSYISQEALEKLLEKCRFVPIIDLMKLPLNNVEIEEQLINSFQLATDQYEATLSSVSQRAFAITIQGDSMEAPHYRS